MILSCIAAFYQQGYLSLSRFTKWGLGITEDDHGCFKQVALSCLVLLHVLQCLFLDYNRNTSLPLPIHGEQAGSSSSEHGSVSPDSDVQHDMFFERPKRSISEIQTKHPISHLLR